MQAHRATNTNYRVEASNQTCYFFGGGYAKSLKMQTAEIVKEILQK